MEFATFGRLIAACVAVGLVLLLLRTIARATLRGAARPAPGGRIVAVLESTALPGSASLHVVRVAERYYVLGRSAAQVSLLCEVDAAGIVPSGAVPPVVPLRSAAAAIGRAALPALRTAVRITRGLRRACIARRQRETARYGRWSGDRDVRESQ